VPARAREQADAGGENGGGRDQQHVEQNGPALG
jgi:hypothetical protein